MPRPEGYASMQFDQVDSAGKQVIVECRHCKNKRLARSVASRKVKHLKQCHEFHRYLAELAASNNEELNDVPEELLHGPQRRTAAAAAASYRGGSASGGSGGYVQQQQQQQTQTQTPVRRQFDVSLPTLLDGLGSARHEALSTLLNDVHDTTNDLDDTPMHDTEPPPAPTTAPATAPSRPRHSTSNAHADSVPERAVAFAHRAAQRRKEKLDNLLTRAIHQGSLPFNINDAVKHPAMAEFFKLVDYVPPNRHKIADDVYDHTHDQSDEIIAYTS
ncbi:hypothetical protein E4T52_09333 [Aureobasidium sp. EXF-3400]|nr:hypothetical protein E4T51_12783 [Aureobasidium sp. EXF-12344]KAI4775748.1 hypothetical protein E4T52_09333 [Aureobasidium sp. EXF-3400]